MELVGILNITPDSFSDGGKFDSLSAAIKQAEKLFSDGAALIDIGAESTRPGASPLNADQEWARLEPVLKTLLKKYPGKISLDSYHPKNIDRAFEIGPVIVNDVTGMTNPKMVKAVVKHNARCIVSHSFSPDLQGNHKNMPVKSVDQVKKDLLEKHALLIKKGLKKGQIILDPGIGFGKTPEVNRQLLNFAELVPGRTVMIGYSRKRFLGDNRMEIEPNLEAGKIAKAAGARYLRVHDVAGHKGLL